MRAFDLAAARQGEPIQVNYYNEKGAYVWVDAHFIGLTRSGEFAVEKEDGSITFKTSEYLRMAPRHTTLLIELWRDKSGVYTSRVVYPNGYASNFFDYGEKVETLLYRVEEK